MNKKYLIYFIFILVFLNLVFAGLSSWSPNTARSSICEEFADKRVYEESDIRNVEITIIAYDPADESARTQSRLSAARTSFSDICGVEAGIRSYQLDVTHSYDHLSSICTIGRMDDGKGREGHYSFRLELDNDASCSWNTGTNRLFVDWNKEQSWCELDRCGFGDYLPGQGDRSCCSAREMNEIFEFTNEDCGQSLVGDTRLCYFMNNVLWKFPPDRAQWLAGERYRGEIIYMGCQENEETRREDGHEYVADSQGVWRKCTNTGFLPTVSNPINIIGTDLNDVERTRGYICINWDAPSRYSIAECNPTQDPFLNTQIANSGINARGGQSVNISLGNKKPVYFCTNLSTWDTDLDDYNKAGPEGRYCNTARLPPRNFDSETLSGQTFTIAGIAKSPRWTGSFCCGEPDDWGAEYPEGMSYRIDNEYYNDDDRNDPDFVSLNSAGACFNSWYQPNESFLKIYDKDGKEKEVNEVMIWHGTFQGCAINEEQALINKQNDLENEGKVRQNVDCAIPNKRDANQPYEGSFKYINVKERFGFDGVGSNNFLLSLRDRPNPGGSNQDYGKLINDNEYCNIKEWNIKNEKYFCSYKGVWENQPMNEENRTHLSFIPWRNSSQQQAECCKPTQCWDGDECIDSVDVTLELQEPHRIMNQFGDGFICVDGDWQWSYKKSNWIGDRTGYCIDNTQCLVDPDGDLSLENVYSPTMYNLEDISGLQVPQCINSGEYYLDHYCENGAWTSRTKYVALELFNIVRQKGDFTLYCDTYDKILNNFNYVVPGTFSAVNEEYFNINPNMPCYNYNGEIVPCVNRMCLLVDEHSSGNEIYLGMSLNMNPNMLTVSNAGIISDLGEAFGATLATCNPNSTRLESCGNTNLYYNAKKNILMFSRAPLATNYNFLDTLASLFLNFVKTLVDMISSTPARSGYDYSLFESLADQLYQDYANRPVKRPEFLCENCVDNTLSGNQKDEVCGLYGNPQSIYKFNSFYLSYKKNKKIFGMAEINADASLVPYRMIGMFFEGFEDDICEAFEHPRIISGYKCVESGGRYVVVTRPVAINQEISYRSIVDISPWEQWMFLGPSLRIKD